MNIIVHNQRHNFHLPSNQFLVFQIYSSGVNVTVTRNFVSNTTHSQFTEMNGYILISLFVQLMHIMLYVFFWVIPRRLNFIFRRFGTLFHLHRQVGAEFSVEFYTYLPMKMKQCSETSEYKIQTPGNYPEENIQHYMH